MDTRATTRLQELLLWRKSVVSHVCKGLLSPKITRETASCLPFDENEVSGIRGIQSPQTASFSEWRIFVLIRTNENLNIFLIFNHFLNIIRLPCSKTLKTTVARPMSPYECLKGPMAQSCCTIGGRAWTESHLPAGAPPRRLNPFTSKEDSLSEAGLGAKGF